MNWRTESVVRKIDKAEHPESYQFLYAFPETMKPDVIFREILGRENFLGDSKVLAFEWVEITLEKAVEMSLCPEAEREKWKTIKGFKFYLMRFVDWTESDTPPPQPPVPVCLVQGHRDRSGRGRMGTPEELLPGPVSPDR